MAETPWDTEETMELELGEVIDDEQDVITGLSQIEEQDFDHSVPPADEKKPESKPKWGIKFRTNRDPRYAIVDSKFNAKTFKGSFKLVSSVNVPSSVCYTVNGHKVKEVSEFSKDSRMTSTFTMPRGIQAFIKENFAKPEMGIVRFCYIYSLLKKEIAIDNLLRYIRYMVPTTFPAILQEDNSTWSGPFPSNAYTSKIPSTKSLWETFCTIQYAI